MYLWRELTDKQRAEALEYRRQQRYPKHSPPHFAFAGSGRYLITAACYEHAHVIGSSPGRMTECEIISTMWELKKPSEFGMNIP